MLRKLHVFSGCREFRSNVQIAGTGHENFATSLKAKEMETGCGKRFYIRDLGFASLASL